VRALVAHGPGDFRLVDDAVAVRPRSGALLEIEAAGVCAADRMIWDGSGPWELDLPFTPGHEILGRVREIDAGTGRRWGVGEGDRVAVEVKIPCGRCRTCVVRGLPHLCPVGRHLGSALPGAFAERMALPADARVHRVPDELTLEAAGLIEPAATAVHAVARALPLPERITRELVMVVSGIGAIGACALGAAAGVPKRLVALVTSPERAERALRLGADAAVDVRAHHDELACAEAVLEACGRDGAVDVWLDCSGSVDAVELGLDVLAPGGRLVLAGVYRRAAVTDWNLVGELKELDVVGAHLAPRTFPTAIELLRTRAIDAREIVTHVLPLAGWREALEPTEEERLKALLIP
jgi:L-iditol 2-dehydrogenase